MMVCSKPSASPSRSRTELPSDVNGADGDLASKPDVTPEKRYGVHIWLRKHNAPH
jgi:hypothetical protein